MSDPYDDGDNRKAYEIAADRASEQTRREFESGGVKLLDQDADDADSVREMESSFPNQGTKKTDSSPLAKSEEDAVNQLGKGYTSNSQQNSKQKLPTAMFKNNSKLQKRLAFLGAIAGTGSIAGVIIFMVMLPLKLGHIMTNIERKFMAQAMASIDDEAGHMVSRYFSRYVIPSIFANECKSTIDPSCKVTVNCPPASFMCGVYTAYRDGKIESKLAQRGIILGREGSTFYIRINGDTIAGTKEFQALRTGKIESILDLPGTRETTRSEIRKALKVAFQDATLWQRVYYRMKVGPLVEKKYGVHRCLMACDRRDAFNDKLDNKKMAWKAWVYRRIMPEKYSLIMGCVLAGVTGSCDASKLDKATPEDIERMSPFRRDLREKLLSFRTEYGAEKLTKLIADSKEVSKIGFKRFIAKEAVAKVVGKLLGTAAGDVAGQITSKTVVPIVGWVFLFAGVIATAGTIGYFLSASSYALNTTTAVQMYMTGQTFLSECKSMHCDAAVLGSADRSLATSLSGDPSKAVDFTKSRYYQRAFSGYPRSTATASIFDALLPGTAYAAVEDTGTYLCDDGKPIPADKLVCPELNFREDGNKAASAVAETVNAIPGLVPVAQAIDNIGGAPGEWIGKGLEYVPGFDSLTAWIGEQADEPLAWVQSELTTAPEIDSGARQVDMMMAGASVLGNDTCKIQLGCSKKSHQAVVRIQNARMAEYQADFESMPLFARLFNTETPYSLISRIAMTTPSNFIDIARSGISSLVTTPFQRMATAFSSLFTTRVAFADAGDLTNPFGIDDYAYDTSEIPTKPDTYWDDNCVNGPLAYYDSSTRKLDISAWLNQQEMDPQTGEAVNQIVNPCLLVQATGQSTGGLSSQKLWDQGSTTSDLNT